MPIETLAVFFLAAVATGGVVYVFIYPHLSGEVNVERRKESVARPDRAASRTAAATRTGPKVRREQVEETLKELEQRQKKAKRPPLTVMISQAGLSWSKNQFFMISGFLGLFATMAVFLAGLGLLPALGAGFAAGLGLPRWLLRFLKKRREAAFINALPDSVDVIVRGIKAGLPLLDCLKMISTESPEPVRSEFRTIIETQTIGIPLGEACAKLFERVPLPEANFFGIVISIQQKAGGNLAEALGNLSRVLRERKKMRAKIKALSTEAKASASIIGALPLVVMLIVWITSPNYIELLWLEPLGRMMLACSAVWMSIGVMVMKKMINFDF
jgi:tight adherence protein B